MKLNNWFTRLVRRGRNGSRRPDASETPRATEPESKRFPRAPFFSLEKSSPLPPPTPVSRHPNLDKDTFPIPSAVVFPVENTFSPAALAAYLENQGNPPEEIAKLKTILGKEIVILEIGCGCAEIAWEIAGKNPNIGMIATDIYAFPRNGEACFGYGDVSRAWKEGRLAPQKAPLANMVILRAEAELLRLLPYRCVSTLLLVNPEPKVGKILLDFMEEKRLFETLKPGGRQIVIKPFSREMGVMSCGGFEFDHAPDYSRGLGFLLDSSFNFRKGGRTQWSVDLDAASPYSKNSTQSMVSICGGLDTDTALSLTPPPRGSFFPVNLFRGKGGRDGDRWKGR